ncbi:MAG: ferrous iron transport protein B [Thermodesulfobacteriota bacterium]
MRIALAGQPNCGKSTIFNHIAGYKAITSNFPGTTVKYTETNIHINGYNCQCIDLPGTYSLTSSDPAELEARNHLLSGEVDIIINVIDASLLGRSLELTLQLLELEVPMVVCLNMMDEARRKGIQIDHQKLSRILGIPVIPTIAKTGKGLKELFYVAIQVFEEKRKGINLKFSKDIEESIEHTISLLHHQKLLNQKVPSRFLAIKLLEDDPFFINEIDGQEDILPQIRFIQGKLGQAHGVPSDQVLSSERHALAMNLFEQVAVVIHPPKTDIRTAIDQWVMHPFLGYLILIIVFYAFFNFIFGIGGYIEQPLIGFFDHWIEEFKALLGEESLLFFLIQGALQGVSGGIAIVLPYLVPFLIGLSILEDIGYLPRVAFLMDAFMHRIGLHGKAIIPLILGYGCSVPAVMATRILEFPQHRLVVSILSTMIPCSARITIIFALVAHFISANAALTLFALNLFIIALSGKILSIFFPETKSLGLILEIPAYQLPPLKNTLKKSWYRIKEFVTIAWPILIMGSIFLALMEYFEIERYINWFFSPLTAVLGLPEIVGTPLIFGLLRKELSMIMLTQALGTTEVLRVLTKNQIMVFAVFVTFYIPCLATIAALWREIGKKGAILAILFGLFVATFLAFVIRFFLGIFPL